MLETLTIRNFALIESVSIEFGHKVTVLSGETGAGKSILVGALSLLLGSRGDTDSIRTGTEEAEVTALIRVQDCREALE